MTLDYEVLLSYYNAQLSEKLSLRNQYKHGSPNWILNDGRVLQLQELITDLTLDHDPQSLSHRLAQMRPPISATGFTIH